MSITWKMFLPCNFYCSYKKLTQKKAAWYGISLCIRKQAMGKTSSLLWKEPPQSAPSLIGCQFLRWLLLRKYCRLLSKHRRAVVQRQDPEKCFTYSLPSTVGVISNSMKAESPQVPRMATVFLPYYFVESSRFRQKRHGGNKTKREKNQTLLNHSSPFQTHMHLSFSCILDTVCFCLRI